MPAQYRITCDLASVRASPWCGPALCGSPNSYWRAGQSGLFAAAAWVLFQRRDIRVGGEHSWRLPAANTPCRIPLSGTDTNRLCP